jgi:hypothetical protein
MGIHLLKGTAAVGIFFSLILANHESRSQPPRGPSVIVFKDGFVIRGQVVQPTKVEIGETVFHRPDGLMYIDDNVRRIVFPPTGAQLCDVLKDDPGKVNNLLYFTREEVPLRFKRGPIPPGFVITGISDFDTGWQRDLSLGGARGIITVPQRVVALNPKFIKVHSTKHVWDLYYKTAEFSPELIGQLLKSHFQKKGDVKDIERRFITYQFFVESGMYDAAEKELDELHAKFPKAATINFDGEKSFLKSVRANFLAEDIIRLHRTAQHESAQDRLRVFLKTYASLARERDREALEKMKSDYDKAKEKIAQAEKALAFLPERLAGRGDPLADAAKEIAANLSVDSIDRLETFLPLAEQYERDLKNKKKPQQSAEEVLGMGVTGWLFGKGGATTNVGLARSVWTARQYLQEFQQSDNRQPQAKLEAHCMMHNIGVDVIDQLIRTLPPPMHDSAIKPGKTEKLTIKANSNGGDYWLQLPPEYTPSRYYPVLIALHTSDEIPTALKKLAPLAAKNGFILAAPVWGKGPYEYKTADHDLVLDCLKDLRRRFQVDSDRVFLYGKGEGGTMAFDIGLSHPDQFAGILPHSGSTRFYPQHYWPNAQYLNMYVLDGNVNAKSPEAEAYKKWIRFQYPAMYVEYKGRVNEWYDAELPTFFEWMKYKKRADPMRQLGLFRDFRDNHELFKSHREGDNRFYIVTAKQIENRCLNTHKAWKAILPATVQVNVSTGNQLANNKAVIWNQVNVKTFGMKQVSVWFRPGMIDFSKPTHVYHNPKNNEFTKLKIEPNLGTLLEEFFEQGDRQRLFYARVDLK